MWLNELKSDFRIGYVVSAGIVMASVCALYVIMQRLRVREIDIAYIEQSTNMAFRSHGNHVPERQCAKHCGNGTLVDGGEEPEYEIHEIVDPEILWRAGVISNHDPACGMHLVADYYDGEPEVSPEMTRRKTLAEPTLPILPEVPSQENSSVVSRLDCSRRESELDALMVGMGSDDGGSSNACFSTLDENNHIGASAKLSPAPSASALMAQTQAWVRKSSLPEKSPTLPKIRRFSVDPDLMRNAMYIAIPRSSVGSVETVEGSSHSGSLHEHRDGLLHNGPTAGSTPTTTTPSPVVLTAHSSPTSKLPGADLGVHVGHLNTYYYPISGSISPNLGTVNPLTGDLNPTLVLSPSSPLSPLQPSTSSHKAYVPGNSHVDASAQTAWATTPPPPLRTFHSNPSFRVAVTSLDTPTNPNPDSILAKNNLEKSPENLLENCDLASHFAVPEDSTIDLEDSPTITETSV